MPRVTFVISVSVMILVLSGRLSSQSAERPRLEFGAEFPFVRWWVSETQIGGGGGCNKGGCSFTPVTGYADSEYRTAAGVGVRLGYRLNRYPSAGKSRHNTFLLEGEFDYFPRHQIAGGRGQGLLGLIGFKAGRSGETIGLFVKARPAVFSYDDETLASAFAPRCCFSWTTRFGMDLGATVEINIRRRAALRLDVGDLMYQSSRLAPGATLITADRENVIRHNIQFSPGLVFPIPH
jgi:hypothetical protein